MKRRVVTACSVLVLLLAWEFFGRRINPMFGSYPSAILVQMVALTRDGQLPLAFWQSMQPFLSGLAIAALLGVPAGVLLGRFALIEAAFGFYVTAGYALPLIALVPLFILWFGLGFGVKVAIIALLSFFPICINTWLGVKTVPRSLIEVGLSFVGSRADILRKIVVPASIPYVMAGLRLAIGKAVIGLIVAEFFTAVSGLGGIILTASSNFDTAQMLAPIIVIMLFAVLLTSAIGWLEHYLAPWQAELAGQDSP